jgi:hypothetical protein
MSARLPRGRLINARAPRSAATAFTSSRRSTKFVSTSAADSPEDSVYKEFVNLRVHRRPCVEWYEVKPFLGQLHGEKLI